MPRNKSFAASPHQSEWDDWGGGSTGAAGGGGGGGGHGGQQRSGNEYTLSQLNASANDKDNFFNRKLVENASRPEGLPPSQGERGCPAGRHAAQAALRRSAAGAPLGVPHPACVDLASACRLRLRWPGRG